MVLSGALDPVCELPRTNLRTFQDRQDRETPYQESTTDPWEYVVIEEFLLAKRHIPQVRTKIVCGSRTNEIRGSVPEIFIQIGCIISAFVMACCL